MALLTDALHEILFRHPKPHPRLQVIPREQYFHHAGETCTQPEQEQEI